MTAKDVPSLGSVHEVKLEALLNDLVRKEGKIRAAWSLRVNYKTVARSIESGVAVSAPAGAAHEAAARRG